TIVVDPIDMAWELIQLAEFGKLKQNNKWAYGSLNAEFSGLADELYYGREDINSVYIQRVKKLYVKSDPKKDDGDWDGKSYEPRGFNGFDYLVDINATHGFENKQFTLTTDPGEATRLGGQFSGLKFAGDECSFVEMAKYIYGPDGLNHPEGGEIDYWDPD